jgi:outer membrane protein assembly factor BamE (lipoprotein component of BamABCDE complex)
VASKATLQIQDLLLPAILLAFCAAGCEIPDPETIELQSGRDFPVEREVGIKKGRSTDQDVRELLGPPYQEEALSAGRKRWRYYARRARVRRMLLFFRGSAVVTENELVIDFDRNLVSNVSLKTKTYEE